MQAAAGGQGGGGCVALQQQIEGLTHICIYMYIHTCRQRLEAKEAECVALQQQIEGLRKDVEFERGKNAALQASVAN